MSSPQIVQLILVVVLTLLLPRLLLLVYYYHNYYEYHVTTIIMCYYYRYHAVTTSAMTLGVSTAMAERSFSSLRRIKTYLRSTMTNDRLSNLALHVERSFLQTLEQSWKLQNLKLIRINHAY